MSGYKHTEKSVQKALDIRFSNNGIRYTVPNLYLFKHDWETDFLVVQRSSGYCYEIEIKVTRSDFLNDFKKEVKHKILREGVYPKKKYKRSWNQELNKNVSEAYYEDIPWEFRPNKFYYCVPEGMVEKTEVPDYAGLMYVRGDERYSTVYTVKEPKFIHKNRLKLEDKLCDKFYYYWKDSEKDLMLLENKNRLYEKQIIDLKNKML
jgi:hypothetical protein